MEPPQTHTANLTGILTEVNTIIKASYTQFITLALFFLPLSISLITAPTLHLSNHLSTIDPKTAIYLIIFVVIVSILALCATATITYSTHHRFLGDQVNLITVLKLLTCTFLPLASTAILAYTVMLLILLTFLMFVGLVLMFVQTLGFAVDYNMVYIILGVFLVVMMMFFYVNWSLAYVVVIVESKWGFEALKRSWYLVKGMRSVSLFLMLYYGVFGTVMVWVCSGNDIGSMSSWMLMLFTVFLGSYFMMVFWLTFTAANTLLYNYCKALHGELVIEVGEGFGCDYVDLGSDVEKVPHVTVVTT